MEEEYFDVKEEDYDIKNEDENIERVCIVNWDSPPIYDDYLEVRLLFLFLKGVGEILFL